MDRDNIHLLCRTAGTPSLSFDEPVLRIAIAGVSVALGVSLIAVPLCRLLALKVGVVDRPGGRKTHEKVTPLLGGIGVVLGVMAGLFVVWSQSEAHLPGGLGFSNISFVIAGSLVIFLIGLMDDIFKDSMGFEPKLLGQIVGVLVLMWPSLRDLVSNGGTADQWLYQLFFLGWYLTIVNSFNFSDNMNGLMSGLSVISFAAAIMYLSSTDSYRSMTVAAVLMAAVLGFMPYNFPRSRVFLGDTGSMFIGFWMAWVQFDLAKGFMDVGNHDFGASHLIPAVLIMGVPLFDAAYVVFMRINDRRPVYLGDCFHLSHRLVRSGFSSSEAVVILWGLALILAWLGILASSTEDVYRYIILAASFVFMVVVARKIMSMERFAALSNPSSGSSDSDSSGDGRTP